MFDDVLQNPQEYINKPLYVLRVGERRSEVAGCYDYVIYPAELAVKEIRIGQAMREAEVDYYGPGFVTFLCASERGPVQAFSPIGDEILSRRYLAGRNCRGFLDKKELEQEAEILKECVLRTYKRVASVEICLSGEPKNRRKTGVSLSDRLSSAFARSAETGNGLDDEREGLVLD